MWGKFVRMRQSLFQSAHMDFYDNKAYVQPAVKDGAEIMKKYLG